MPGKVTIEARSQARRVTQELRPGEVVGLGPGLPGLVPGEMPSGTGVWFLADSGILGYWESEDGRADPQNDLSSQGAAVESDGNPVTLLPGGAVLSTVDLAAMVRGGHVDTAVLQTAQVTPGGDFTHWTTAAVPGLFPPASAVDWASGAKRIVAMMPHTSPGGSPNIVNEPGFPVDGIGCVDLIITGAAVVRVTESGLELAELAPGWTVDDVTASTGAPLRVVPDLKEMTFGVTIISPPSKVFADGVEALRDLPSGAVVNIDGFAGPGGMAHYLLICLRDLGPTDLTLISNTAGIARVVDFGTPPGLVPIDHSILVDNKQVKKAIASYPVSPRASRPSSFELAFQRGQVDLEVVPQGTLAERLRAGGAGVAAFYTPTAAGTLLAEGKETRIIDGREHVLETGLKADFCLIRAHKADTLGNLVYKGTSRNFNAVMAPAATITVVEVDEIVQPGELSPEEIVTPGVYIHRIVKRPASFSPYEQASG